MVNPLAPHLDERVAFVGRTGSGKTNAAKVGVELLLAQRARVCILDPTDAWWGLRLAPDGHALAHRVIIFGGDHADLPLTPASGDTIGSAIAGTAESCIVSLANFIGEVARRRFAADLLSALYEKNRDPLHLIVDEADTLAPQKPISPLDNEVLARMQQVVRRGRIRGFVPWLLTQRPAVLNKDVLSQADVLVAFNLTSSQDRAAIGGWIEGQADRSQERAILADLPKLPRGSALLWAPGAARLETVRFPLSATFDSGRTPRRGERRPVAVLAQLDVGALRQRIAAVQDEATRNDPARLHARIRDLEAQLKQAGPSVADLADATARGRREGRHLVLSDADWKALPRRLAELGALVAQLNARHAADQSAAVSGQTPTFTDHVKVPPVPPQNAKFPRQTPDNSGAEALGKSDRAILTVLAQNVPQRVERERLAAICGYSPKGGGFANRLSSLRTRGLIEDGPSPYAITAAGHAALGAFEPLPTGMALRRYWQDRVPKASREILVALAAEGGQAAQSVVAERAGYNMRGGGFQNALSRLRTLGLVSGSRLVRLHPDLL